MSQYDVNQPQSGYTEIAYGWDVVGADGDKIGNIAAIQPHYISVEKGFLSREDLYIPTSTITSVQDETVYLSVTRGQIEHEGWDSEPEMTEWHRETADYNEQLRASDIDRGIDRQPGDRMHIPLSEEHLEVRKHETERGRVHVHKDVVEEQQVVGVPLREEEVRVERRTVDGQASGRVPDDAFQEQDIEIPIRGEEAEVTKRARVREEVDIHKDVRERTEHARDTVRREQVYVDHDENLTEEDRP